MTTQPHRLVDTWVVRYRDRNETSWTNDTYRELFQFQTLEEYWAIYPIILRILPFGSIFFMKKPIFPNWEDPMNVNGSSESFICIQKDSEHIFQEFSIAIISGQMSLDNSQVNGFSWEPRFKRLKKYLVKVWLSNTKDLQLSKEFALAFMDKTQKKIYKNEKW